MLTRSLSPALLAFTLAACGADSADQGSEERALQTLAWSVLSGVSDLHNQYVVGTPEGAQDSSGECPFGGQVHITGNTIVPGDGGPEHVELSYDLSRCRIAPISTDGTMHADLTLDGVVDESGSLSTSSSDESYRSDLLQMVGTVTDGDTTTEVDRSCALRANVQPGSVNVLICDQNVAW